MSSFEVLCTTMFQKDLSKFGEMNIQANVIFANQDDRYEYVEEIVDGNLVKMVTTPHRGVGRNRNMSLLFSTADILLFSDDDMVYAKGYEACIIEAFDRHPDADIIIFNIEYAQEGSGNRTNLKSKRACLLNVLNYAMPRIAVRKTSLEKSNIWITSLFGGGSKYCNGEDNLFLVTALKKGLRIYTDPYCIGNEKIRVSSWFTGFNKKFFFDNGAFLEAAFPFLKHLFVWYFAFKFSKKTELSVWDIWRLYYKGMSGFRKGISYDEWEKEATDRKQ
jgi:glycosyltransferase involved in cell wall biosynthesis